MLSDEEVRGFLHGGRVQVPIYTVRVAAPQGVREGPIENPVAVCLGGLCIAGMEVRPSLMRGLHDDIRRQAPVQGIGNLLRRNRRLCVEDPDIAQGVHPGVGPAGTQELYIILMKDLLKFLQKDRLYSQGIGLYLAARVSRSVVSDDQHDPHQKRTFRAMVPARKIPRAA